MLDLWSPKKNIQLRDQRPGLITQELLCSSFIKVRKGTEKASNIDIRKGMENAPVASLAAAAAKSLQSCLTLCDPIDGSPLGSSVPGILQARILEWVAISFSNAWKWKVKVKSLSWAWLLATLQPVAYRGGGTSIWCHVLFPSLAYHDLWNVSPSHYLLDGGMVLSFSNPLMVAASFAWWQQRRLD